jgi:hypothetical protein
MRAVRVDPDLKYVALSDELVARASNHADVVRIKLLLKHFFNQAVSEGKVPVMPKIDCFSPWIKKGDDSFLGIDDLRVADDGEWCYPGAAGFDSCWPNLHFVYPHTLRQQNIGWEVYHTAPPSEPPAPSPRLEEYHEKCGSYFSEFL